MDTSDHRPEETPKTPSEAADSLSGAPEDIAIPDDALAVEAAAPVTPEPAALETDAPEPDIVSRIVEEDAPRAPKSPRSSLRNGSGARARLWSAARWLAGAGAVTGAVAVAAAAIYYIRVTDDLPTLEAVREYKPAVMTRVHAGDGKLITEYSKQARVYVPVESIPPELQQAFVAAEDQRFYTHGGWDPIGLTRATLQAPIRKLRGQRIGGTSTLTQQVAKNFLTGDDYSIRRKVREIAIARRLERAFTKDEIVELYLNEIYFGRGAYGVAAASLKHFGKPMSELSLAQMTYLASVPKGPANYRLDDPRGFQRAKARQSYILGRMVEDGYITQAQADTAKAAPLEWIERLEGSEYLAAEYFNEEVRKEVFDRYGEDELYEGGLSVRTSLDTDMQLAARRALREGLEAYDLRHGYRGPLGRIDPKAWRTELAGFAAPPDIGDWRVAVVLDTASDRARLGLLELEDTAAIDPESGEPLKAAEPVPVEGELPLSGMKWAGEARANGTVGPKPSKTGDVLSAGDVILVAAQGDGSFALRQVPAVNGAILAMDPHTGRILALVGGYSFQQSQFNRATQAYRQPGSSFKPFVYAAALENGFTPASQVLDAPFVIEAADNNCRQGLRSARAGDCNRYYKPSNYSAGQWYGLSTLRLGIEKSRNAMTVRLANDIGMGKVGEMGERLGIYDDVPGELAWSLGAGETTLLRLANAYATSVNGGKKVTPSIIDRVQDGTGRTVFRHPEECVPCYQDDWTGQSPPELSDTREVLLDPVTAYQTTFMMQGVVDNGTGRTIAELGRPLGGKTGTTNDYKDAWFMGFSPDLVAGVYVGFDTPETMGREAGGVVAAPIFKAFMGEVLADAPVVPFRIPEGVSLAPVNRDTGEPSFIGAENYILEAFRPGSEPGIGSASSPIGFGSSSVGSPLFGGGSDTFDYDFATPDELAARAAGENMSEDGASEDASSRPSELKPSESSSATPDPQPAGPPAGPVEQNAPDTAQSASRPTPPADPLHNILNAATEAVSGDTPANESSQERDPEPDQNEDPLENIDDGLY